MRFRLMLLFLAAAVLTGSWPGAVQAAVVGRYLQVEGQVEVSRGGKTIGPRQSWRRRRIVGRNSHQI